MQADDRIYVAGHTGMVGSAIVRWLELRGYNNLILDSDADLASEDAYHFMIEEHPEFVFMCAAHVGGIKANVTRPATFLYENLLISLNTVDAAYTSGVKKLLMLGSSCMYPRDAPQPLRERYLLSGRPEETNRAYAIAKIATIELCDAYRRQHGSNFVSVIPCNLYGSNDTYNKDRSHVIPALIHKMHLAKERGEKVVELWGTGKPLREFLHVDDLAQACLLVMDKYDELGPINVGSGEELTIADLACEVAKTVQFEGDFCFSGDLDGVPRKVLDSSRIRRLGWEPTISLRKGLAQTYESYLRDSS